MDPRLQVVLVCNHANAKMQPAVLSLDIQQQPNTKGHMLSAPLGKIKGF